MNIFVMSTEIATLCEGSRAEITFIRSLGSMLAEMVPQVAALAE